MSADAFIRLAVPTIGPTAAATLEVTFSAEAVDSKGTLPIVGKFAVAFPDNFSALFLTPAAFVLIPVIREAWELAIDAKAVEGMEASILSDNSGISGTESAIGGRSKFMVNKFPLEVEYVLELSQLL